MHIIPSYVAIYLLIGASLFFPLYAIALRSEQLMKRMRDKGRTCGGAFLRCVLFWPFGVLSLALGLCRAIMEAILVCVLAVLRFVLSSLLALLNKARK